MKQSRPHHVFHVVTYRMANYSDPIALVRAANALLDGALLNGQPYIRSIKGGKQHSPQGMAEGMQVVFVIEFESEADRDYWVYTDPAYKAFKAVEQRVGVESKLVFDFTDSKY